MNVSGVSSNYYAYGTNASGAGQGAASGGASQGAEQMAQQLFSKLDTDGDGAVTESEMETAMQQMGPPPMMMMGPPPDMSVEDASSVDGSSSADSRASELFAAADTNGDGTVTEAELEAAMEKMHKSHHGQPPGGAQESAFDPSAMASELFAQADADGDGSVTEAELKAAMEKMGPPSMTGGSSQNASGTDTSWLSAQGMGAYQDSLLQYMALSAGYGSQQGVSVTA